MAGVGDLTCVTECGVEVQGALHLLIDHCINSLDDPCGGIMDPPGSVGGAPMPVRPGIQ